MSTGIHEASTDGKRAMEEIMRITAFLEGEDSERGFYRNRKNKNAEQARENTLSFLVRSEGSFRLQRKRGV